MSEEVNFLYHAACDNCDSKDNVAVYDDGHGFCFGCNKHYPNYEGNAPEASFTNETTSNNFITGERVALPKRKLNVQTTQHFNYQIGKDEFGKPVQIANYYNKDGVVTAQKLRYQDKTFRWIGDSKEVGLFGQNKSRTSGKQIVITEGEVDAMSMSQVMGNKYPVVSIKSGANGAVRDIRKELEFLESFEKVIIMFDNDEVGKTAAIDVAKILSPTKAFIAELPLKDAGEMLVNNRVEELTNAMWNAKAYRPDGIVSGVDLWEDLISEEEVVTANYPFEKLNEVTDGVRKGELVTLTAGTGIGKSLMARHIAHGLLAQGYTVGWIGLEESVKRSALGILSCEVKRPLHLVKPNQVEGLKEAYDKTIGSGRLYLYDHFGSVEADNLISKIKYLANGCQCDYIFLDHLSIAISGLDFQSTDERKLIDYTMTTLRSKIVEATGVGLFVISHLRRPEGNKGYEEGLQVSLNSLRGSHAIAQLSDMVIGLERNHADEEAASHTTIRLLKNRFNGVTGTAGSVQYNLDTGCLEELSGSTNEF